MDSTDTVNLVDSNFGNLEYCNVNAATSSNPIEPYNLSVISRNVTSVTADETLVNVHTIENHQGYRLDNYEHCHVQEPKASKTARNQLIIVCCLSICFMLAEIAGGIISGSLALITDATHLASDITGFCISLFAIWISAKQPTSKLSFGYARAEILGALASILIIWVVTGVLCFLATKRMISNDYEIKANEMLITASLGVGFNIVMGIVLHIGVCSCSVPHSHLMGASHGHSHGNINYSDSLHSDNSSDSNSTVNTTPSHVPSELNSQVSIPSSNDQDRKSTGNINVRAALIHVIGDFIQSIGVLIAAIIIKVQPQYKIADPICTFLFSALVLITTITVLKDVLLVLMEGVPGHLDYSLIKKDLLSIGGVHNVHSLHIWNLNVDKVVSFVHLGIDRDADWNGITKKASGLMRCKYKLKENAVQLEVYDELITSCDECSRS